MTRWTRGMGLGLLTGLLGLGGCSRSGRLPTPKPVQLKAGLSNFKGCGDLQQYIQDTAVLQMRSSLEGLKLLPRGGVMAAGAGTGAAATPAAAGNTTSGPSAYTTTNNQVPGVDEADFVKNDGTRIFSLSGNTLYANQSWPASALSLQGSLALEGWPHHMFLNGNQVVVFSYVFMPVPLQPEPVCASMGMAPAGGAMPINCWAWNTTKVTTVDVSDLTHLKVVDELYLPGAYDEARMVQSSVRLVLEDALLWPQGMQWYPQNAPDPYTDKAGFDAAVDQLEVSDEALIRATPLASWLPVGKHRQPDGTLADVSYQCTDFARVNAPTRLGLTTVATLDLARPGQVVSRSAILAEPGAVYATPTSLYVANWHWWWWPEAGQTDATYVHKFDISQPDKAVYLASGTVPGDIRSSYAMDELDGKLRVASTAGTLVITDPTNNPWGTWQYSTNLSVLAPSGDSLETVGQSSNISPNQQLTAVRFVGNQGYLSTGTWADPFLTFDLSDPTQPRQVGTLDIAGSSNYLYPVDATHLLAVGMVPSSSGTGGEQLQVSLFDVSNLAQPRQMSNVVVGTGYSWSDAVWDPKAFNYFPARQLLAIPFADWNSGQTGSTYWSSFTSDLRVFHVDTAAGITPVGALNVGDMFEHDGDTNWVEFWQPEVRRSVMADNYVYAIGDSGLRVADVASLTSPLATVNYPVTAPK